MSQPVKFISLNIETQQDPETLELLGDLDIKYGNTKDPAKRAEKEKEVRAAAAQKMALDPFFGKIACATLVVRKDGQIKKATKFSVDVGEVGVLQFISFHLSQPGVRLITFNGAEFDWPYIILRYMLTAGDREKASPFSLPTFSNSKYDANKTAAQHCDVFQVLTSLHSGAAGAKQNLAFYVKTILGVDFPLKEIDQSQINRMIDSEYKGIVQELCEWNATHALLLYERVASIV